jgi:hypothetical protein
MTFEAAPPDGLEPPERERRDGEIAVERQLATTLREVVARAARHPLRVLAVASVAAGLLVVGARIRKPTYVASLTFRMEEGSVPDAAVAPPPPAQIREYISTVALSRERVLRLMEKHGLSATMRQANPVGAVHLFREDLDVRVIRNYFLFDRDSAGPPRSALVVVSYGGANRDLVEGVLHDVGEIILEQNAVERERQLARAQAMASAASQREHERLRALETAHAELDLRRGVAAELSPREAVALGANDRSRQHLSERMRQLGSRAAELELAREAEALRLGLSFRLIDEGVRVLRAPLDRAETALLAAIGFLLFLPSAAIVLGAFDGTVYGPVDLVASGVGTLGVVPGFEGDDVGTTRQRRGDRRRRE